jgi:hypothetical protein
MVSRRVVVDEEVWMMRRRVRAVAWRPRDHRGATPMEARYSSREAKILEKTDS